MKVDLIRLKKAILTEFDDLLLEALEDYGFKNPRIKGEYIQCGFNEKSSGNSIIIMKSNDKIISFKRYSNGVSGDIIDLFLLKGEYGKIIYFLKNKFSTQYDGTVSEEIETQRKSYLEVIKSHELVDFEYEVLPESFIGEQCISVLFLRDRVRASTQLEYKVWECDDMERICLNWRDLKGNLVGVIGRYNDRNCTFNKYLPIKHNFKKTLHLFGLYENLNNIIKHRKVYIFEAEKSVLQTSSNGYKLSVSCGYANISANQLALLKYLKVKDLYFCPDEDIDILDHAKALKKNIDSNGYNFNIYYIWDKEKKYLSRKQSPADLPKSEYEELIKNCIVEFDDIIKLLEEMN